MVRSNFDYSNRPSSGEKLGTSIASDFWKKASQSAKTTKTTSKAGGTTDDVTSSDLVATKIDVPQTRLDIRIPDKALTDAGWKLIADALLATLQARPDLTLTDLDLSGNELTIKSLTALAPVLDQAPDLQVLNLSSNHISAPDAASSRLLEPFMHACWSIPQLLLLDISGNRGLGTSTLECMARAAARSAPILHETRKASQQSQEIEIRSTSQDDQSNKVIGPEVHKSPRKQTKSRRRAVSGQAQRVMPYKIQEGRRTVALDNVDLTDHGTLFLADVACDDSSRGRPTHYTTADNRNSLSRDGESVLQLIEGGSSPSQATDRTDGGSTEPEAEEHLPIQAGSQSPPKARGTSFGHGVAVHDAVGNDEAMLRVRKKIQRSTIIKDGYRKIELWEAAMRVFTASRGLYLLSPSTQSISKTRTPVEAHQDNTDATDALINGLVLRSRVLNQSQTDSPLSRKTKQSRSIAVASLTTRTMTENDSPASAGAAFGPELFAIKQPSANALKKQRRKNRSHAFEDDLMPSPLSTTAPVPSTAATTPRSPQLDLNSPSSQKYLRWQQDRTRSLQANHGGASDGYRDASLRSRLPLPVCQQIMSSTVDDRDLYLLSDRQQKKAIEWAQLHDSLSTEYDWRNKDQASQIWMLLETLECLEYE